MINSVSDPQPQVWLGRINPVAQIVAILVITITALATIDLLTPAVLVIAELTLLPAAGLSRPGRLFARTWPLLLSAAGVAWVNLLFSAGGGWDWPGSAALGLRVIAVALPGVLFIASTDPVRVADALTIHWRMSTRFAYGALAAIRLAPLLVTEWQAIRLARRARGVDAGRNPITALRLIAGAAFSLLVGAIRRGSRLALAMDARGFDSSSRLGGQPDTPGRQQPQPSEPQPPEPQPRQDDASEHLDTQQHTSERQPPARIRPRTNARGSVLAPRDYLFMTAALVLCASSTAVSIAIGLWDPLFIS